MTFRADLDRMERIKCKICEQMVENMEEHVRIGHKRELEQVLLTKKDDDVSVWIRERTGGETKVRKVIIL
jgi:hypothetical protein